MKKELRKGKVLVDWSQNDRAKTTVAVYSLRRRDHPTVSTPVTWDEVERAAEEGTPTSCASRRPTSWTGEEARRPLQARPGAQAEAPEGRRGPTDPPIEGGPANRASLQTTPHPVNPGSRFRASGLPFGWPGLSLRSARLTVVILRSPDEDLVRSNLAPGVARRKAGLRRLRRLSGAPLPLSSPCSPSAPSRAPRMGSTAARRPPTSRSRTSASLRARRARDSRRSSRSSRLTERSASPMP